MYKLYFNNGLEKDKDIFLGSINDEQFISLNTTLFFSVDLKTGLTHNYKNKSALKDIEILDFCRENNIDIYDIKQSFQGRFKDTTNSYLWAVAI